MYYNTNDVSIYYEKFGNSDKTILILPGWGDTRKTFYPLIESLKDDFTIYILDYPGFGNSPFPAKDLTIYDYTNLIRDFLTANNIHNPNIIAHSFGGRITTLLTGYYKEQVDKLILIDIAAIKPKKALKLWFKEKTYKLLKKLIKLLPKQKKEKYRKKLLSIFASTDYKSLSKNMHQTFKNIINEDLKDYLPYIENETLLLWGENDLDTPLKDAYKLRSKIKNSALIVFPKATHYSYLEYKDLTGKIIKKFLLSEKDL